MIGFATIFFGVGCNTIALSYGNILLLSSSSSFTMIFNLLMARFILKEDFNVKWDGLAIILVLAGSSVCVIFSKNEGDSQHMSEDELFHLFVALRSIIFLALIWTFMAFSWILAAFVKRKVW